MTWELDNIAEMRDDQHVEISDNAIKLRSDAMHKWQADRKIERQWIARSKPAQIDLTDSFDCRLRHRCLSEHQCKDCITLDR